MYLVVKLVLKTLPPAPLVPISHHQTHFLFLQQQIFCRSFPAAFPNLSFRRYLTALMFSLSNWYISHNNLTTFVFARLPFLLKLDKTKLSGVALCWPWEVHKSVAMPHKLFLLWSYIYIWQYPVLGGENSLFHLSTHWSSFADKKEKPCLYSPVLCSISTCLAAQWQCCQGF